MFFLSDAICETMLCDVCHRTLSVGPVKVYANRQTKCGRCSQQGDEGVISMYNSIVRQAVFKCINRFDGCRQLLTYAQVADHESTCKSKKEYHSDYNLKTPSFWGKLSDFNTETYLYKEKDNLFFIRCAITSACISLKVFYLGDQKKANKMKQKFIVYYGINGLQEIETSKMECVAYGIENVEGSLLSKPQTDIAHIVLELDVLEGLDIFCCSTSELSKQISLADNFLPFGDQMDRWNKLHLSFGMPCKYVGRCRQYKFVLKELPGTKRAPKLLPEP
ncbi:hypothetical protein JTB14_003769 [Gonioctena quinquepunctata]|nr:hypothetical protein JTB14_003769 [Gonioctena quinquepunctata]